MATIQPSGIIWILGFASLLSACEQIDSYDDCILENIHPEMNQVAVQAVIDACESKYPKPQVQPTVISVRQLSEAELSNIEGTASMDDKWRELIAGRLYNGNEDVTVTEVGIQVTSHVNGVLTTRKYVDDLRIQPFETGIFTISIIQADEGAPYSWELMEATGYDIK